LILPDDESAKSAPVFLDLSARAMEAPDGKFEEGLNGLAFHPSFRKFGAPESMLTMWAWPSLSRTTGPTL
jgi:hypothetical protein